MAIKKTDMYFDNCNTIEECKELYKTLAKKMHPDMGGDADDFKAMFDEYSEAVADLQSEPAFLKDEYINLAKAVAGIVKTKKPEVYKTMEGVAKFAPTILSLFDNNKTAKNVNKFLGKLGI